MKQDLTTNISVNNQTDWGEIK